MLYQLPTFSLLSVHLKVIWPKTSFTSLICGLPAVTYSSHRSTVSCLLSLLPHKGQDDLQLESRQHFFFCPSLCHELKIHLSAARETPHSHLLFLRVVSPNRALLPGYCCIKTFSECKLQGKKVTFGWL